MRVSCTRCSTQARRCSSRQASFIASTPPPNFNTACRRASSFGQARALVVLGLKGQVIFELLAQPGLVLPPRRRPGEPDEAATERPDQQFLRLHSEEPVDDRGSLLPVPRLGLKLTASGRGSADRSGLCDCFRKARARRQSRHRAPASAAAGRACRGSSASRSPLICSIRLASPYPCSGPITSSVLSTIRASVP